MRAKPLLRWLILAMPAAFFQTLLAQVYTVEAAGFNSDRFDDYSPVFYNDGIVFCSNRKLDVLVVYASEENTQAAAMWFAPQADSAKEPGTRIFSRTLLTNLHDGPATFSRDGRVVWYSRNLEVESGLRDISGNRNKLGLFRAELVDGAWTGITAFPYNSSEYSITTPALSPDGNRIFFASNMPGGFGGADLYFCELEGGEWLPPVNLGPDINTPGNESYPFLCSSGILYFASDGREGFGKKDIYYTSEKGGKWTLPFHMDRDINSAADDFGLITDENGRSGYFTSNRKRSDDIYYFRTDFPAFRNCDSQRKNHYCFLFYDEGFVEIDTLPVRYEWNFGDGTRAIGTEVEHCFPGPGNYTVELNIIDDNTGNIFFTRASYEVAITNVVQPFITSPDQFFSDREIEFGALESNLPHMEISGYFWDFGDGTRKKGAEVIHTFGEKGSYTVRLGVTGEPDSTGQIPEACVFKQVVIE